LLQCNQCRFAFTGEIPTSDTFFDNRYDNKGFDPTYEVHSNRKDLVLDEVFGTLKLYYKGGGELLDVGSFAGKLLRYAQKIGFTPSGVEVNPKLAEYSKTELGFDVIQGKVQQVELPVEKYDVITVIDVLEHLVEPYKIVGNLAKALKPGGHLVIKVPHYNMQIIKQKVANKTGISRAGMFGGYGHINHFNHSSMEKLVELHGMKLLHTKIARSEHWPETSIKNRCKNLFRDCYWKFSNLLLKLTGINLGMNSLYIIKK
jgi:2-polyprenyl-3-methyl-5-hydroxy-6-metoxy-1,4-benzoquinol methylase